MNNDKKKEKNIVGTKFVKLGIGIGIFVVIFIFMIIATDFGVHKGTTVAAYEKHVVSALRYYDMPEDVQDFKFVNKNFLLAGDARIAFTLDEQKYDEYVEMISEKVISEYSRNRDFVGRKVSDTYDCYDNDEKYQGIPQKGFEYLTEDDLGEYTIIYYEAYTGSNMSTKAVMVNSVTRRVVVYNFGSN